MKLTCRASFRWAVVCAVASAAAPLAFTQDRKTVRARATEVVPAHTTAEDVLKALRERRPRNKIVEPASAAHRIRKNDTVPLDPEGTSLVNRAGRIRFVDPWWVFAVEAEKQEDRIYPPLKMLPNAVLEGMVMATTSADAPPVFVISGELTVFQGENYLLARFATRESSGHTVKSLEPKSQTLEDKPADDWSAEDVLARLSEVKPTHEVVMPPGSERVDKGLRRQANALPARADGSPLVHRPGRLGQQRRWWTFIFESDHVEHPEPPMRLLPNKNVERMVRASQRQVGGLLFLVSGEVTTFRGENYLLPRAAMRRIPGGQLKK